MIFGSVPIAEAEGTVLAHTRRLATGVIKKGSRLDAAAVQALRDAGYREVIAARLEPGDVAEDEAADRLAAALMRPGLTRSAAATGRVNLFAEAAGLLSLDVALIDRLNSLDESLTLATLPAYAPVAQADMVATIKVIPFAVPAAVLAEAEALARSAHALSLHPFRPLRAGLVMSRLPGMKSSVLAKTEEATRARVETLGATLLPAETVEHDEGEIAAALLRLHEAGAGLLMVIGASAVVDRRDVGPAGIVRAGGEIAHFGMPVDPGNLLCLGSIGRLPALVLPGCARSPKLNGFDWVLQRIVADVPVTGRDIQRMGAGGLLTEIETRPLPRARATAAPPGRHRVAAVVLAAGLSRRMGPVNKLLAEDDAGRTMVARVVDNVLASRATEVIVVTGHEHERVAATLDGRAIRFVHAPDYAEGLAASLRAGVAALPDEVEGALICLGDMPLVSAETLDRLIGAFDPAAGRAAVQPVHEGQPGNPVLWGREFFPEILELAGDKGARALLTRHAPRLATVNTADDGVLRDFDTAEALATIQG
ncbi:NTP transferase domain-containing protein [Roseomonas elaeocarpi]|uniref:NTP transferase domain-containing protein n=1 Tax=Roseomonas elaeocarpi TaxID=907779 RepID=A0ABV6JYV2_9PROT